jgi:hypothetical protein
MSVEFNPYSLSLYMNEGTQNGIFPLVLPFVSNFFCLGGVPSSQSLLGSLIPTPQPTTLQTQPLQLNPFNSFANTQHPHPVQNGMANIPDRSDRHEQERAIMLELLQILVKDRSEIRSELSFLRSQVISISEQITSRPWFSK